MPLTLPAFSADIPTPFEAERLVGRPAPDFTLNDVDGRAVRLSSFRGSVVVLNFWGTWSPPSRDELPALDRLHRLMKPRGVEVLAVSTKAGPADVRAFLRDTPVGFPVLLDEVRSVTRSSYRVFVVPTTFIIGRDGVIREKYFGIRKWDSPGILGELQKHL